MSDKPVILVVSDLHLGGGPDDPGDDHVYQNGQLRRFIEETANSDDGRAGRLEMFINGDFLEFAQVRPDVYNLGSSEYWCSEEESVTKLDAIIKGHRDIFDALKKLGERGNQVTFAAGNHDVDLYWDEVQKRIRDVSGNVRFETGKDVCNRHDGRLLIGHGHMIDPANSFKNWADPFLVRKRSGGRDELRLEMCPGTLFMVKFVNGLEDKYRFSDNLKPVTALARLLLKEQRWGFVVAAWSLLSFLTRHPILSIGTDGGSLEDPASVGNKIVEGFALNERFRARITDLYKKFVAPEATDAEASAALSTVEGVNEFVNRLLIEGIDPGQWLEIFDLPSSSTLGSAGSHTLSVARAGMAKDKEDLRREAELRLAQPGVEVVVFGHTHQPDEWRGVGGTSDGGYFNPGSWTRYVDVTDIPNLKLEDLKREEDFPYQLNYVRIEQLPTGSLRADKICFEEASGDRFKPGH